MTFSSPLDHLADHDCTRCSLHETTARVCIMGRGSPKAKVMILGEAPGANEADTGKVFSGRAGQLLDDLLHGAGFVPGDCYISNVVKCRPPDNRKPERTEWEACRTYLEREYRSVSPSHVLLLGNAALQAVARKSGITKQRGIKLDLKDPVFSRATTMATFHPAYILRNPGQHHVLAEDFRRFSRLISGELSAVAVKTRYVSTVEGLKNVKAWLEALPSGTDVSYDVENYGRPWDPPGSWGIVCLGISVDGERSVVIPLDHPQSPFRRNWRKVLAYLKPGLERRDFKHLGQNAKHDNVQLAGAGVFVEHRFDIMLAAHILDENRPKNLGYLSQALLGADVYKGMVDLKPEKILTEPIKKIAIYNGYDVGYSWQLKQRLKAELVKEPRLARLFTKLVMPASHVVQQVEMAGMWVDQERLWSRIKILKDHVDQQLEVLNEHNPRRGDFARDGDFNYNSTQQLGRWLFSGESRGGLGLDPIEVTKSGNPSTREAVLLHYHDHPAVAALLRYRTLQLKWLGTCLIPWSTRLDARSRLHTTYKLYGTVTGRASGDLQQVPRDSFIRSVIGAPPGWRWLEADLSQAELRVTAHCAPEKRMIRAFLTGQDLHLLTASTLTGKEPRDVTKEERKKAKAVNFGFVFGMYPKKFQAYAFESYGLSISLAEAEVARAQFFELYPDLVRWHDRMRRVVHAQHFVTSPLGRVRHLPDVLSSDNSVRMEAERQAINSPIQATATDIMFFAMVHIAPQLKSSEAFMVMTLHDAIALQVREDKVDKYKRIVKETMENLPLKKTFGLELRVPVVADVEDSQHWHGTDDASGLGFTGYS